MRTRSFFNSLMTFISLVLFSGCFVDRTGTGCHTGMRDDEGRCVELADASDAGYDSGVSPPSDGGFDAGYDASLPDTGPPPPDAGFDAGRDSGPPPMDAGVDAGFDAGADAGPPGPLHINFNRATVPTGIVFNVVWNEPPPVGRRESGWRYRSCRILTPIPGRVEAQCDVPELLAGRMIQFIPYDDTMMSSSCNATTCPSLCDRTTCPGYPADYSASYESRPVLFGEFLINSDPGSASDGPAPGDSAWISFLLP